MWDGDVRSPNVSAKGTVVPSPDNCIDYVNIMHTYDSAYTGFYCEDQDDCIIPAIPLWIISGLMMIASACFSVFDIVSQHSFYMLNIINIGACGIGILVIWYCYMLIAFNRRIKVFVNEMQRREIPIQHMCKCVYNVWRYKKDPADVKDIRGVMDLFMTEHKWVMLSVIIAIASLISVYSVFYIRIYSPIEKYCEDNHVVMDDVTTVLESDINLYVFDLKHGVLTTTKRLAEENTKRVKETTARLIGEINDETPKEVKKDSENLSGSKH